MTRAILFIGITIIAITLLTTPFLIPHPASAQNEPDSSTSGPSLPNPLGQNKDGSQINLLDVMLRVLQICLAAVDIFALFMFILGGFELLISGGNPNLIKKAKDTLIWATIGILVITFSYSILKFLFEEVSKRFAS